jgi:predicted nucleic acid-binding Zn ribbon protein
MKICIYCKKEFEPIGINREHCYSKKCRKEFSRDKANPPARQCKICPGTFTSSNAAKLTCSDKCAKELNRRNAAARHHKVKRSRAVPRFCGACGDPVPQGFSYCQNGECKKARDRKRKVERRKLCRVVKDNRMGPELEEQPLNGRHCERCGKALRNP